VSLNYALLHTIQEKLKLGDPLPALGFIKVGPSIGPASCPLDRCKDQHVDYV
jgi:hypothetical protein